MQAVKKILFKLLGEEQYLKMLNRGFFLAYNSGLLKRNYRYKYHYYVQQLIKKGDHVVDLGANLGYYTKLFSKWAGEKGKVIAIEPVPLYMKIIRWTTRNCRNVELIPYALGKENKKIHMVTPFHFGYLRAGLSQVHDDEGTKPENYEFSFEAEMVKASDLFAGFERIDYFKCDIEGYEIVVLPEIMQTLLKFKPTIQLETWGDQKEAVENLLAKNDFIKYQLNGESLEKVVPGVTELHGDFIFIHKDKAI
ncbi:MAG TPA: FkbM family methyltransferase [Chitinophagaceae bacterium]